LSVIFWGIVYVLTRLCLWGSCSFLQRPQYLAESAVKLIDNSASFSKISHAQDNIKHSLATLAEIPFFWTVKGQLSKKNTGVNFITASSSTGYSSSQFN
jgi:hypothetical protein